MDLLKHDNNQIFPAHIRKDEIQTCTEHCRATAKYACEDLSSVGLGKTAYLAGILHDCGKYTDEFRKYITAGEKVNRGSVIHTFAGVNYILGKEHDNTANAFGPLTAELIAYAVGAHHGLFDCVDEDHRNGFEYRLSKQPKYEKKAINNFISSGINEEELNNLFQSACKEIEAVSGVLAGIACDVDEETYNDEILFYLGLVARLLSSAVMDGDRRDTAEFMNFTDFSRCISATPELWHSCLCNVEDYLASLPQDTAIQKARKEISDICRVFAKEPTGIYRLNVPTGGGKTLSSLRYALAHAEKYGKKRIIYTAPLISILDQNAEVIRRAVKNDEIILEHHSNIIIEEGNYDEEYVSFYDLLTETWDSPIIITTMVQLLNTFFSGQSSSVRRFQSLCDSVIIIDEVQAVPENILSLFNLTLNFISNVCNATIILCSATQPCLEEIPHKIRISDKQVIEGEAYWKYYRLFKRTELISKGNYKLNDLPSLAEDILREVNSLLVICNTKSEAVSIFNAVKKNHENCFHLSASMCMDHRKDVLAQLYESLLLGKKTICIATQVIEAGVDISFDAVIRISAGIDNIVQAAGRCNRNGDSENASPVYIVRCEDERLGNLQEIKDAQNATNNLLSNYENEPGRFLYDLASEESVKFYYQSLYHSFPKGYHDYSGMDRPSLFNLLSSNERFVFGSEGTESYVLRQAFRTAGTLFEVYDQNSESVVVPYRDGNQLISELCSSRAARDAAYFKQLLQKAKNYSISVYRDQLLKLQREGAVQTICEGRVMVLGEEWYDNNTGLVKQIGKKEDDEWNTLIL